MANTIQLKRKNLDLPAEIWQKLSILAVSQGMSLKAYAEKLLAAKASQVEIIVRENPSPSGDAWWNNPENTAIVDRGVADAENGRIRAMSIDEVKDALGL